MGCGCKQKPEPIVPKGIKPIVVETVSKPEPINYTIEQLIRVKDFISSINKTETERQFVQDFMMKQIGMIVPDYCDQICLSNLRLRVKELEDKMKIN